MSEQSRPSKPSQTIEVGKLKVTVTQEKSGWSGSAIRLTFNSESDWLLKPERNEVDQEPATADKLLAIIEDALTQQGMILEKESGLGGMAGKGSAKSVSLRTMHNFDDDHSVVISATQGYYPLSKGANFTAATIADEVMEILSGITKKIPFATATRTKEALDELYDAIDVRQQNAADAIAGYAIETQTAAAKHESPLHAKMAQAVEAKLPGSLFETPQARRSAVEAIVEGALGEKGKAWARTANPNLQGTDEDPLRNPVDAILAGAVKPGTPASWRTLIDEEVCDAINTIRGGGKF